MTSFRYSALELKIQPDAVQLSKFDKTLREEWERAMSSGLCRYDLSELECKVLPGPHQYVALLNEKRATERRPPEAMHGLNQPFNEEKFNFIKANPKETLIKLEALDISEGHRNNDILINISPCDYCHSLIVPEIDCKHNQNLTEYAIKLALQVMCLSSQRSFRIGFNSLCAHASVNHQHLHCYYTDSSLLAEAAVGKSIGSKGQHLYMLDSDAPTGYGFQLREVSEIDSLARFIFLCTNYMRISEIAHCLFITRGGSFEDPSRTVVKVLLWPRTKVLGPKPSEAAFNTAVLELAGHLLVKERSYFETITDESAYRCLRDAALTPEEFEKLTEGLLKFIIL